jgi:signal peptidase I
VRYRDERGRYITATAAAALSSPVVVRHRDRRGRYVAAPALAQTVRHRDERGRFVTQHVKVATATAVTVVTDPVIAQRVVAQRVVDEPVVTAGPIESDALTPARPRRSRPATTAWFAAVAVLATFLLGSGVWLLTGGRFFVVSTPSMSPTVPVGSLVLTRPVPPGGPKVGQIIAFHPPSEPNTTYTHRVYKVLPGPTYQTKGDLDSGPDAWVVLPQDIVGVSTHHYRGVGFLVRGLPWLALGTVIVMIVASMITRPRRRLTYLIGGSLVASFALWMVNPLVRGVFVDSGLANSRVRALVVNTGLLPIRFTMKGATPQHATGGYPATLTAKPPHGGNLLIHGRVDLSLLGWVLLALLCATPLLIAFLVPRDRWVDDDSEPPDEQQVGSDSAREPVMATSAAG